MKKPNFFIVGAPKCGTTALTEYLSNHPEIYMCPFKEFHLFGSDLKFKSPIDFEISLKRYLKLFSDVANEKMFGEASVMYLYSQKAANEIKEFSPESKIIVMLRNPVDMMHSHHSQLLFNDDEVFTDFEDALRAENDRKKGLNIPGKTLLIDFLFYKEIVKYHDQVKRYFDVFGKENVHVIIFDDFKKDTALSYKKALHFLNVNDSFQIDFKIINPNKEVRFKKLQHYLKYPPSIVKPLKLILPDKWRWNAKSKMRELNRRYTERNPINPKLKQELLTEFIPEIDKTSQLLNRDLSFWYRDGERPKPAFSNQL